MRRLLVVVVVLLMGYAALSVGAAQAGLRYPLHYGDKGTQVCGMAWLLSGKGPPSVYRQAYFRVYKGSTRQDTGCFFSAKLAHAVRSMKYKLGYCPATPTGRPKPKGPCYITARFDYSILHILTGKIRRTQAMQRASLIRRHPPLNCDIGDRIAVLAEREVGVVEVPYGSNHGGRVTLYEGVTKAYYAAWCATFAQAIVTWAGIGPIANASAGVGYIAGYAQQHGWLRNDVRRGYLVAWGSRHMGIIDLVTPTGYYTIEGNSGNGVRRRFYRLHFLQGTLIRVPGTERKISCESSRRA